MSQKQVARLESYAMKTARIIADSFGAMSEEYHWIVQEIGHICNTPYSLIAKRQAIKASALSIFDYYEV